MLSLVKLYVLCLAYTRSIYCTIFFNDRRTEQVKTFFAYIFVFRVFNYHDVLFSEFRWPVDARERLNRFDLFSLFAPMFMLSYYILGSILSFLGWEG